MVIPETGAESRPNLAKILCEYQSNLFQFRFYDRNKLRYVDFSGEIPPHKRNWCEVKISLVEPSQLGLDSIVEVVGIPTVNIFVPFIDMMRKLLKGIPGSNSPGKFSLSRGEINKIGDIIIPISSGFLVPRNLDQANEALSLSRRLLNALSGLIYARSEWTCYANRLQELAVVLQEIVKNVETWIITILRPSETSMSPVNQVVDEGPDPSVEEEVECRQTSPTQVKEQGLEPSGVVGDSLDNWVEVTGTDETNLWCDEERVEDEALDFVLLSVDR